MNRRPALLIFGGAVAVLLATEIAAHRQRRLRLITAYDPRDPYLPPLYSQDDAMFSHPNASRSIR